jgi:hypothetical protein
VYFVPKSVIDKIAVTSLSVGIFLTEGSLAVLTSMLGIPVIPSSLKTEYPVIGQAPSSAGSVH